MFLFVEHQMDTFVRMQLLDLARTLTRNPSVRLEFSFHSYYHAETNTLAVSQFWSTYPPQEQLAGMKSDVCLRGLGSAWYSDSAVIQRYLEDIRFIPHPGLAKQLFALCEDIRLETVCVGLRPGTARNFAQRRRIYSSYFHHQLLAHLGRHEEADAFLLACYFWLGSRKEAPLLPKQAASILFQIQPYLNQVADAASTEKISSLCKAMMDMISSHLVRDTSSDYFSIQGNSRLKGALSANFKGEEKRHKAMKNDDEMELKTADETGKHTEQLPSWHRESGENTENFLRFELEQGTKTNLLGDAVRETDPGDQAMAVVQGSSQFSAQNDYSRSEGMIERLASVSAGRRNDLGEINRHARPIFVPRRSPTADDTVKYDKMVACIEPWRKSLVKSIQRMIEQKQTARRQDLLFGRLSRKLTRMVTDENPRLFYKKKNPVSQFDAAFMLLVDCSGSMYDKMDQTQLGITLFHETLRSLRIPHEVIGFWEEADQASAFDYPNCFQTANDFGSSLTKQSGLHIVHLCPQQDNRDGYAIRLMMRRLLERTEKQRFLLVFTDGEPAASNYAEDGILDTYQAVWEARRQGVAVVGVFLANGEITERQRKTMENIYGRYSILVPKVEDLAQQLIPILRKLLVKTI